MPGFDADIRLPLAYCTEACALFQQNFSLSEHLKNRQPAQCLVEFKIRRDGTLYDVRVVEGKGTGNSLMDNYALNAIIKTAKLAPLPAVPGLTGDHITATVPFAFGGQ